MVFSAIIYASHDYQYWKQNLESRKKNFLWFISMYDICLVPFGTNTFVNGQQQFCIPTSFCSRRSYKKHQNILCLHLAINTWPTGNKFCLHVTRNRTQWVQLSPNLVSDTVYILHQIQWKVFVINIFQQRKHKFKITNFRTIINWCVSKQVECFEALGTGRYSHSPQNTFIWTV
jgi:hypothetical protein